MTTNDAHSLILRITRAFVAHPLDLRLTTQTAEDGSIYWAMTCHEDDEPKLIGRAGSHAAALRYLVTQFGRTEGLAWTFRAITPSSRFGQEKAEQVVAKEYDPTPAEALLAAILAQLEIGNYRVRCDTDEGKRTMLAFRFIVSLENPTDYGVLKSQRPFEHKEGDTMSTLDALSTLYRAMAKTAGVRFKIVVEEP